MKNKIITTVLLAIIIIFSIQLSAQAVIVSTDKQVESGSGTVTISVTSNQALGAYTLKLTDTAGLTLVSASGGEVSADKKTITGSSAEGTKSLGTYTFNVPTVDKDTKYNIKFSITGMETPSLEAVANETNTAVLTVKAPVIQQPETPTTPEPTPEPEPETPVVETPNFTNTNKTMYAEKDMYLRASWSTGSAGTKIAKGTEITVTATSNNTVNKYVWYRVTYKGNTYYAASILLTTTKPTEETPQEETPTQEPKEQTPVEEPTTVDENNDTEEVKDGLRSLEIEGITLTPAFNPHVYEYRAIVKKDISELAINAIAASEGATVTIAGNQISEGENLVTIVVYNAKNEVEATYQITINKNTLDLSVADNLLKNGTLSAKRERTIYITIFTISFIGLIVVMILRSRIAYGEDDYEEDYENSEEFTQNELTVENAEKITLTNEQVEPIMKNEILQERANEDTTQELEQEIMQEVAQDEIEQEEIRRPRREKRKGKHF